MSKPKKFYSEVTVAEASGEAGGASVLLDERPMRTPGKNSFRVPNSALAEAVAEEWRAQDEEIDPETMPLTRLVNTAIDAVEAAQEAVREDILNYANADLLCYRAEGPEALTARQTDLWDPLLAWAKERYGARLAIAEGVIHVDQPEASVAAIGRALEDFGPFALTALHVMTSLTGSALLPLAVAEGRLSADEAWAAAHVDEDWQVSQWGEDEEAAERRARRRQDFAAAAEMLRLS